MDDSRETGHIARSKLVLEFVEKQKESNKIGPLYNEFCKENGDFIFGYKTFQRIIEELAERELIKVKKIIGGEYGTTRIIEKLKEE